MTSRQEVKCYLYWIKTKGMQDIFTEGYVGISIKPKKRCNEHLLAAKNDVYYYKTDFKNALLSGMFFQEILLVGSVEYCLEVERKLRPSEHIGWNNAVGGREGKFIHGLSGTPAERVFRTLRTRAKSEGIPIADDMANEALEVFCDWYTRNKTEDTVLSSAGITELSLKNLSFVTKQESVRESHRKLKLKGEDTLKSIVELSEEFGIRPNTLTWRLKRGATLEQAVYLEEKPKKYVTVDGKCVQYNGSLSQEQISSLIDEVRSGTPILALGSKYGMDHSSLSRALSKLGVTLPVETCTDFFGDKVNIHVHSKLSAKDYETVKQMLQSGSTKINIARHFNVSSSTLTFVCKKLKWEEFCEQQKRTLG